MKMKFCKQTGLILFVLILTFAFCKNFSAYPEDKNIGENIGKEKTHEHNFGNLIVSLF